MPPRRDNRDGLKPRIDRTGLPLSGSTEQPSAKKHHPPRTRCASRIRMAFQEGFRCYKTSVFSLLFRRCWLVQGRRGNLACSGYSFLECMCKPRKKTIPLLYSACHSKKVPTSHSLSPFPSPSPFPNNPSSRPSCQNDDARCS